MTYDQYVGIEAINTEYVKQAAIERDRTNISAETNTMLRRYRFLLLRTYIKILNRYLNCLTLDEYNFITEEEAQDVLDRINLLCDTDYDLDLTISDVTSIYPVLVWDDTLYWDDTTTWSE